MTRSEFGAGRDLSYAERVATLRGIHRIMNDRRHVVLTDGRVGKIVRVDTVFPSNDTTVTVWTETPSGPGVAKVHLEDVVGPAEPRTKPA